MQEIQFQSLNQEDPLQKVIATHSSILAWEIPWTEQPDELQSTGLQESDIVTEQYRCEVVALRQIRVWKLKKFIYIYIFFFR